LLKLQYSPTELTGITAYTTFFKLSPPHFGITHRLAGKYKNSYTIHLDVNDTNTVKPVDVVEALVKHVSGGLSLLFIVQ
jgi:hypothetical protein